MWAHSKSMAKALLVFTNVALRGGGGRERESIWRNIEGGKQKVDSEVEV